MREQLRDVRLMLATGWRIDRRLTTSLVTLTVATNAAGVLRALWFKLLIDAVVAQDMNGAVTWAAVLSVSDAFRSWALVGSQMDRQDLHDRALQHFQEQAMRLAGAVPGVEHHERQEHLDRISVLRSSFAALASALGNVIDGIAQVIRAVLTFVLLATLHPALIALPLFALPSLAAGRRAEQINQRAQLAGAAPARRSDHLWTLLTTPSAAKEVRVFGLGAELQAREREAFDCLTRIQVRAKAKAGLITAAGWTVFALGYVAAILFVLYRAAMGEATAGDVLLAVVLAGQVNFQVAGAVNLVGLLTQALHAVGHYRWLLDYRDERTRDHGRRPSPTRIDHGIDLVDVRFTYPGTNTPVLTGIDLHLPAGSVVAVVGENGAGKTTLVKLLMRLYAPTAGAITVDGVDLADIELEQWRQRTAAAFQDYMRYEFIARHAIGVGDLDHHDDTGAVTEALERAGGSGLPGRLPAGLDTQLGKQFRDGTELSGGQWQTLGLSRAMMRTGPLLLVLDEPTAALDATAEHALFQRYAAGARRIAADTGAITVLVSHRFSTVRMADLIVVLDDGRVSELGDHRRLVANGGLYAELYGIQARPYR
jgi:ATP-binding cassette, subfamily B, bacterial